MRKFTVTSSRREELIDITSEVKKIAAAIGGSGLLAVYVPHTTAAVTINEGADPDVAADLVHALAGMAPRSAKWRHSEGNSDAHTKTSLVGPSVTLIVEDGVPILGTWQKIFLCEFDGPRTRTVMVGFARGEP